MGKILSYFVVGIITFVALIIILDTFKTQLNTKIISFLDMLVTIDNDNTTKIERPFSYYPYINMNPEQGYINDRQIFPIGDSFFCGHPKFGNGLSIHLEFINLLVEKILVQIPSYKTS